MLFKPLWLSFLVGAYWLLLTTPLTGGQENQCVSNATTTNVTTTNTTTTTTKPPAAVKCSRTVSQHECKDMDGIYKAANPAKSICCPKCTILRGRRESCNQVENAGYVIECQKNLICDKKWLECTSNSSSKGSKASSTTRKPTTQPSSSSTNSSSSNSSTTTTTTTTTNSTTTMPPTVNNATGVKPSPQPGGRGLPHSKFGRQSIPAIILESLKHSSLSSTDVPSAPILRGTTVRPQSKFTPPASVRPSPVAMSKKFKLLAAAASVDPSSPNVQGLLDMIRSIRKENQRDLRKRRPRMGPKRFNLPPPLRPPRPSSPTTFSPLGLGTLYTEVYNLRKASKSKLLRPSYSLDRLFDPVNYDTDYTSGAQEGK